MHQGCAVILAAGTASRMGSAKQLLTLHGCSMLEQVISLALAIDFSRVIAVIGHEENRIQQSIHVADPRFRWVVNPHYQSGQSTSFRLGIEQALPNHRSVTVFLGDQPFIKRETVHQLWERGQESLRELQVPFAIQPMYLEKPGHPVFFGNVYQGQFDCIEGDQGARSVLAAMEQRVFLPVDDPGIHVDIDTPEDFEQALHIS